MKKEKCLCRIILSRLSLFIFMLFIAFSIHLSVNSTPALAKTNTHYFIKNARRGVSFCKTNRLKKYKIYATNANCSISINQYYGNYDIYSGSKLGDTTFIIKYKLKKSKKWKKLQINAHVIGRKKYAKQCFSKQNKYRKKKKRKKLVWSDVAYSFAKYRLKRSGFDRHQNLQRDAREFFGSYYYTGKIKVGENLIWSSVTHSPYKALEFWKSSARHKKNLLRKKYRCGAMALTKSTWIAVFFENKPSVLSNFAKPKA